MNHGQQQTVVYNAPPATSLNLQTPPPPPAGNIDPSHIRHCRLIVPSCLDRSLIYLLYPLLYITIVHFTIVHCSIIHSPLLVDRTIVHSPVIHHTFTVLSSCIVHFNIIHSPLIDHNIVHLPLSSWPIIHSPLLVDCTIVH